MLWRPWSPFGCAAVLLVFLDGIQAHNPTENPEYYVFRGDSRDPDEIRAAGGFVPDPEAVVNTESSAFSLDNHVNARNSAAYVSTSREFGQAARNFGGPGNWVYRIHVTPNMIDVNQALGSHPYPRQVEASALGGILWSAVEGFLQLDDDPEFPEEGLELNDDSAARITARYDGQFRDLFVPNPLYNDQGLGGPATLTREDPDVAILAASTQDTSQMAAAATNFMNRHATTIGWTRDQAFPYVPPAVPPGNEAAGWQNADVSNASVAQIEDLTQHRYDELNCPDLASSMGFTFFLPMSSKRSLSRVASVMLKARDEKKDQCDQLHDFVVRVKNSRKNSKKPLGPAKAVFFGAFHWPEEAKKQGGFLPELTIPPGPAYEVEGEEAKTMLTTIYWSTKVLQTHLLFGAAAKDAAAKASKATKGFHGIVYAVHATPNMLLSGKDCIAVGGILWSQVIGWVQVPLDYTLPEKDPKERKKLRQHFENAFKEKNSLFQKNEDYDPKFNDLTTTSKIPDFNLPQTLIQFMNKNGKEVGWNGGFPLFNTQRIMGLASKVAKQAKTVAPPHEPSTWEKVGHFMESHVLALALLPAAVVANLIPGLGEVADAAEIAALSTEAVEGIGLTEISSEGASELTPVLSKLKVD